MLTIHNIQNRCPCCHQVTDSLVLVLLRMVNAPEDQLTSELTTLIAQHAAGCTISIQAQCDVETVCREAK